jgi:sigma-B regulation protein RsbU (phosphoserine phosphatase)
MGRTMANVTTVAPLREQLVDRRQRLAHEIDRVGSEPSLERLLQEVDAALERVNGGTYGLCETCHDPIETDRLLADPLVRFCLDHLTAAERLALERDLQLAAKIQRGLLTAPALERGRWEIAYRYRPAGIVSGDYCDQIATDDGDLYWMVGDVSGKGVAAAMLMSHLHAMFRALVPSGLSLEDLMERASRVFCESTLPTHYATLVCGRARETGDLELCNAGHPPPFLVRDHRIERLDATGLPLGLFCSEQFAISRLTLAPGDTVLVCTDGLFEAEDRAGMEYGADRVLALLTASANQPCQTLVDRAVKDLESFAAGAPIRDDVTVMAIRRI